MEGEMAYWQLLPQQERRGLKIEEINLLTFDPLFLLGLGFPWRSGGVTGRTSITDSPKKMVYSGSSCEMRSLLRKTVGTLVPRKMATLD